MRCRVLINSTLTKTAKTPGRPPDEKKTGLRGSPRRDKARDAQPHRHDQATAQMFRITSGTENVKYSYRFSEIIRIPTADGCIVH